MLRIYETAQALEDRLREAEEKMKEIPLWPALVFEVDGSDVVIRACGFKAGGIAVGAGGPGLRYDPARWQPREFLPADGITFTCQACQSPGELRFAVLSPSGREGELLRIRGEGAPVLWLPAQEHVQVVDEGNNRVECVMILWAAVEH